MPALFAVGVMLGHIIIAFVGQNIWDAVSIVFLHGMLLGPQYRSLIRDTTHLKWSIVVCCGPFVTKINHATRALCPLGNQLPQGAVLV